MLLFALLEKDKNFLGKELSVVALLYGLQSVKETLFYFIIFHIALNTDS